LKLLTKKFAFSKILSAGCGFQPSAQGIWVLGIISSLEEMMGPSLPKIVDATLLPFKNRIIYDGTLSSFNIVFGSGIRRSIDDSYRQAKSMGIISPEPLKPAAFIVWPLI
jgi:hypothetical protein